MNGAKKVFGFETGRHLIEIEAETEEKAEAIFYKKFSTFIDKQKGVEKLGERVPKHPNRPQSADNLA